MAFQEITFGLETDDICGFTPEQRTATELQLCVSLAELGPWLYWNFKYPRFHNFFGYAQIMSAEFVVRTVPIEYINQEILWWRDISVGINQTTGCYAKGLAELIGNGPLVPNTVKTRQRYTSVRFKFLPGILANCCLKWETVEARCGDILADPNDGQGNPPPPKNHQHKPEDRPQDQGGDNADPTVNDGMPYEGESDRPPYAQILPPTGQWWSIYTAKNGNKGCETYSGSAPLAGATDPNITPVLTSSGNGYCPGTLRGTVTYNGVQVDAPEDYTSYTFEYRSN